LGGSRCHAGAYATFEPSLDTVDEGKIRRNEAYTERADALEAAGLSE
jgi:hypothetical protein